MDDSLYEHLYGCLTRGAQSSKGFASYYWVNLPAFVIQDVLSWGRENLEKKL